MRAIIKAHSYHRNGVGGEGFYSVEFTTVGDVDSSNRAFVAVVTMEEAYVMVLRDVDIDHEDHFRGTDFFHAPLIAALTEELGFKPFE